MNTHTYIHKHQMITYSLSIRNGKTYDWSFMHTHMPIKVTEICMCIQKERKRGKVRKESQLRLNCLYTIGDREGRIIIKQ